MHTGGSLGHPLALSPLALCPFPSPWVFRAFRGLPFPRSRTEPSMPVCQFQFPSSTKGGGRGGGGDFALERVPGVLGSTGMGSQGPRVPVPTGSRGSRVQGGPGFKGPGVYGKIKKGPTILRIFVAGILCAREGESGIFSVYRGESHSPVDAYLPASKARP